MIHAVIETALKEEKFDEQVCYHPSSLPNSSSPLSALSILLTLSPSTAI